jgi:hypothetical protein
MTPEPKDKAPSTTPQPTPPATAAKTPPPERWWHDAGHSATQEREAAQRARDEAAGFGPPTEE